MGSPTILVLAPMPAFPTSAGNRRRLVTTCESLKRGGFAIDFAYFAHEDQIYRRFGQHPPTDMAAMAEIFQRTFLIEADAPIPLKTKSRFFGIDDWCPDAVGAFVSWYFAAYPDTAAILVNYVFLSRCLAQVPAGVLTLIDTHDRFADRQQQYRPFRAEPNFFYTDRANEAVGLGRADVVLAIQSEEAAYFRGLTDRRVHLLPPRFLVRQPFRAPARLERIGFIGHGNDPNLFSISKFAHAWADGWIPGRPELVIAGEICNSLGGFNAPGVRLDGYVARLEDFYAGVDLVVAPMLMGSGLKMKVAEALSFGLPVIGTTIGFEGFDPTEPAHRETSVHAVKAQVLALTDDAPALAALTAACADLFSRYNAVSRTAEDDLIALLRQGSGGQGLGAQGSSAGPLSQGERDRVRGVDSPDNALPSPQPSPPGRGSPCAVLGAATLTQEHSLRSLERDDPGQGILVATQRLAGGTPQAEAAGYTPMRTRWFASPTEGTATDGAAIGPGSLALSPEWVRDRRLPTAAREALATAFVETPPDWESEGRLIGSGDEAITIAALVPSFLVTAPRPAAAFLVGASGRAAAELTLEAVTALQASPGPPFASATRRDLTPVPAALVLRHEAGKTPGLEAPGLEVLGLEAPGMEDRLLLLTDDLIGLVTLVGDRAGTRS